LPAISLALALSLAAQHAPMIAPDTLVTFAQKESGLDPLAIHDNLDGRSYQPTDINVAEALATRLVSRGHDIDAGFMQVNYRNLLRYDVPIRSAFTIQTSMRIGGQILAAAWQQCAGEPIARMRCAAQIYNSGKPTGAPAYATGLFHTAQYLVPSITRIMSSDFPVAAPDTIIGARRPDTNTQAIAPETSMRQANILAGAKTRQLVMNGWAHGD
jgi:type IV secretion system protein VirB1